MFLDNLYNISIEFLYFYRILTITLECLKLYLENYLAIYERHYKYLDLYF